MSLQVARHIDTSVCRMWHDRRAIFCLEVLCQHRIFHGLSNGRLMVHLPGRCGKDKVCLVSVSFHLIFMPCLVRFECSLKFRMHRNASFGIPLFCLFLVDLVFSLTKMDSQAIKTPVTIPFCFLGLLCKKLTGHEPDNPQFGELNES